MISFSVDCVHMRYPMNTYKGEETSRGKLNVIASLIWVSFFQITISLLGYVVTFSGQLYFGKRSTQQLLFWGSYFFRAAAVFSYFRTVTFSQELFFQNSFFFGAKILYSSHFLRTAIFSEELFRKKSDFFKAGTSAQHQPFQKRYSSKKSISALPTFSGELSF